MIRVFALFALANAALLLGLYACMVLFQRYHGIPGWEVESAKYPHAEQAYVVVNIFVLTALIFAAIAELRSELQVAYIENFITNLDEKEVNHMMLRTVEVQGPLA